MGTLYIVPTPLGNLDDMTFRAVRILREVSLIATEDTRTTGRLLKHFEISGPLISYHEHSPESRLAQVVTALAQGDVALVSEAGTPLLSDPGYKLVRAAIEQGFEITPLPGPSAITTALSASGLPTDQFLFAGFLPRKKGERQRTLTALADQPATLIFFESPHRLPASLNDMADLFGADRQIAIGRELTKLHEEIWRGTLSEAAESWAIRPRKGEFTLVVAGKPASVERWAETQVQSALQSCLSTGSSTKDAVRHVTAQCGWPRREVYAMAQRLKDG